jgi:hypothetical protein
MNYVAVYVLVAGFLLSPIIVQWDWRRRMKRVHKEALRETRQEMQDKFGGDYSQWEP